MSTSALDAVTEASIAGSLKKLSENRTTIVVAHKLSSIRDADVIFVMDDGELIESGSHNDLIKRGKHYSNMVQSQNSGNSNLEN